MKKIILLFLLVINAYACLCMNDITTGFNDSKSHIKSIIDEATEEINKNLIPAVEQNTKDIKKQNEELEKLLKAYMQEAEQKRQILFLLEAISKAQ